jgi:glycosyltransferase involved in cell wall biosynthesis
MGILIAVEVLLGLYMLINIGRLLKHRMQPDYLHRAFWQTSLWLIGLAVIALLIGRLTGVHHLGLTVGLYGLAVFQIAGSFIILASIWRNLRTTRPPRTEPYADRDLPTLTVCLPARNETTELEACLASLTASDYPKLEIIVLDDCSQNKRTPEIIRDFAHAGVRFMAGKVPPDRWLAKNYAYQQLAEAANGEILLFCGVDCRFEPASLRHMVTALLHKRKAMVSFLPRNLLKSGWSLRPLLVQPGRYAWELALPRRLLNRPPVLSTCWLITRPALEAAGGFAAISRKAVPESYFARAAALQNDGYSFIAADARLGLSNIKDFEQQQATAVRTRYPQLHRRPEMAALVSLAELIWLVWPFCLLVAAAAAGWWWLAGLSLLSCLLLVAAYALIVRLTYRRFLPASLWFMPFATLYDIGLLNYSLWRYEFGEVIWKGRNVCLPVMRIIDRV